MDLKDFCDRVLSNPLAGSNGSHSLRLIRVAQNVDFEDERQSHLISRVEVFCRSLATDLEDGRTSPEDAATLLEQLAKLGDIGFDHWLQKDRGA